MQFFQLIGTQRSGSNLFRLMLNEFDDIYAPHPPHLLSTFYHLQKNYNDFDKLVSDMVKWVKFNPIKWNNVPSWLRWRFSFKFMVGEDTLDS